MSRLRIVCGAVLLVLFVTVPARAADMGVAVQPTKEGLLVRFVAAKSLADQMGIKCGDFILKVNNTPVKSREQITAQVGEKRSLSVEFRRSGKAQTIRGSVYWPPRGATGGPTKSLPSKKTGSVLPPDKTGIFWSNDRPMPIFIKAKK